MAALPPTPGIGSMQQSVTAPLSSRWIWAPLALVVVLAIAWSGFWFYASQRAQSDLDAWFAREAQAGRVYGCAPRDIGGYPFRIEVRCESPSAHISGAGAPFVVSAGGLMAVEQIYDPSLVIAEITGPLVVAPSGEIPPLRLDWKPLQASVRLQGGATPERVSIVIEAPTADAGPPEGVQLLGTARHVELHGRRVPGSGSTDSILDLAVKGQDLVLPLAGLAAQPIGMEATAVLRGVHDLAPKPWAERLRDWQAGGGRLEITRLRVTRGDAVAVATGELGLTAEGRLEGALTVTATSIAPIAEMLLGPTQARTQAAVFAGLSLLGGRTELEGKRAVILPLRFQDGNAALGPIPIGRVEKLF